jgi:hypothetical protein
VESTSPQPPGIQPGTTEPEPSKAPTKVAVLLFIGSIIFSVLLVAGSVSYAIWHANGSISANDADWCTALTDLTKVPVSKPADPAKNPSREFAYQLYTDFTGLEKKFRCQ